MNNKAFFEKMKNIQIAISKYIDTIDDDDEYDNEEKAKEELINFFIRERILNDSFIMKYMLKIISSITKNHCRKDNFLHKIRSIFQYIKSYIKLTNYEIFDIFKKQKIILLLLIEEKIITIDQMISDIITKGKYIKYKYPEYFYPEIKEFLNEEMIQSIKKENLPENYEELRRIGENDQEICKLIREDLIDEFVPYISRNNYNMLSKIDESIFETNSLLIKKEPTLIEYAAFFGSIQIFKYLHSKNVPLTNSCLIYGIHSFNFDIINYIESEFNGSLDGICDQCLEESIKCHHNEIANYFLFNFINEDSMSFDKNKNSYGFHYCIYIYFPDDLNHQFVFFYACKYDYINIVENFLKNESFDINAKITSYNSEIHIFFFI